MIRFHCDFCEYTTHDGDNLQASNILHKAISRKGNERKGASPLLGDNEQDFCNACYARFLRWVEGDLTKFVKDNFPLVKNGTKPNGNGS